MQSFVESAPPLAVIWDSDGTVVASEQVIIMASNSLLTARGMPALGNDELKAGFHMPTATRLASIIPEERRGAGADLAAEFYTAATQLATRRLSENQNFWSGLSSHFPPSTSYLHRLTPGSFHRSHPRPS
jgi:beta-phosphoglucomutase-like phosphatase (HAD superfamily)